MTAPAEASILFDRFVGRQQQQAEAASDAGKTIMYSGGARGAGIVLRSGAVRGAA